MAAPTGSVAEQPSDEPNAYDILSDLCFDLLTVQIATLMFWGYPERIRDDHFAEYVHGRLLDAAHKMGWNCEDSSHFWTVAE